MAAVAIVPYIIRWGPDGWQDMLREVARCTKCGKRGRGRACGRWPASRSSRPRTILPR
jgi:hypothetical protein